MSDLPYCHFIQIQCMHTYLDILIHQELVIKYTVLKFNYFIVPLSKQQYMSRIAHKPSHYSSGNNILLKPKQIV